jgi:hypothetical protein
MNDNLQRLVDKAHVYSQYETGVGFNLIDYSDKLTELILLDVRELIQEEAYVNKVVMVDVVLGQLLHAIEERFNG